MSPPGRITLKAVQPLVVAVIFLLAAIFLGGPVWIMLATIAVGLVVVAYVWVRGLASSFLLTRRLERRLVAVGDRLEEHFELRRTGWLPLPWIEIRDYSTVPGYSASVARSVGDMSTTRWTFRDRCGQRGHFQVGPWDVISGDPFGLFRFVRHYPIVDEVIIHPPVHTELPVRLPAGRRSGGVRGQEKALQATINAAGVRAYRPFDPLRWIHWPTTARRAELFVREFDLDAAGDLWILLDLNQRTQVGEGLDGTEEHAVLLAASLASEALADNRAAGLAAYGHSPVVLPPQTGAGQQWQILQSLAMVQADGEIKLQTALEDVGRVLRRGTALVVITADLIGDWLPALSRLDNRGVAITVALFDPASFGGFGSAFPLQSRIHRLGYEAQIIRQGEVGRPIQPDRPDEIIFKVTPMGRVIAVRRGDHA